MDWQNIAVWVTAAAVVAAVVRGIVRRLRGKGGKGDNGHGRNGGSCCGCVRKDCPDRISNW